jgi:gluconolactonase
MILMKKAFTMKELLATLALVISNVYANENILQLDPTRLYNLPTNFEGNSSQSFLQTNGLLNGTAEATKPFIAYHDEFVDLISADATLELIYANPDNKPVADEMGIWVWDHNQVWMSSSSVDNVTYTNILNLENSTVTPFFVSSNGIPIVSPNGGGYYNGKVYIAGDGNATIAPAIYEIDPVTFEAHVVVDSYFGLRFNGPNDLTWGRRGNKSWLYFTDDPLSYYYSNGEYPVIPDATWRWDPDERTLIPVIDRTDILVPNGIRVNKDSTKLYVTDTPSTLIPGSGFVEASSLELYSGSDSSAIYVFDLSEDGFPQNKRLFGLAQRGIPDGMHIDDEGRVWTGESDGIVVRSPSGKVLGMINALAVQGEQVVDSDETPLQNFALAGDKVIVLAYTKIYQVQLSRAIVENMT